MFGNSLVSKCLTIQLIGYTVIIFLIDQEFVSACGPGRAGGRHVRRRRYPPLVQRQYIPNVSENTLGASGRPEGPIKRHDKRFRELVQNWNPDIDFRDDERTGADRMMSQRLKEKLSVLAISVMNQWPNVRLRVIEGWDEEMRHSPGSLHYEGRAVDITTSDKDKSKYGMLARLAVEAGFDWVHYESRSHVHCSVKSEKADTIRNNGCFDAKSLVQTPMGHMEMSNLQTNDLVLTMNSKTGQLQFSPILMWLDKDEYGQELFVELKTKSGRQIRITSSHLIYVADEPVDLSSNLETTTQSQPNMKPPTSSQAGNNDNNQNNNNNYYPYYYEINAPFNETKTNPLEASRVQPIEDAPPPATQSRLYFKSDTQVPKSLDEYTYTTYARNVIVGQYLLINTNDLVTNNQYLTVDADDDSVTSGIVSTDDRQNGTLIQFDQIVSVNYVNRVGIYAPLTREGNIVVNSVVASCYAVISDHEIAHLSFAPIRWYSYLNEWLFGLKADSPLETRLQGANSTVEPRQDNPVLDVDITYQLEDTQPSPMPQYQVVPIQRQQQPVTSAEKRAPKGHRRKIHWYPLMLFNIAKFILPDKYLY